MTVPKRISESSDLIATSEIAELLNVHRSTVWTWVKSGMLTSTKVGTFHGVEPDEFERFLSVYQVPKGQRKKIDKFLAAKRKRGEGGNAGD